MTGAGVARAGDDVQAPRARGASLLLHVAEASLRLASDRALGGRPKGEQREGQASR
jgi:hypothetical protein